MHELKRRAEGVLKGRAPLQSLTTDERERMARYYERVARRTRGRFAEDARLYNLERARYLRGEVDHLAPTLPSFVQERRGR